MSPAPLLAIYSSFSAFGGVPRMMVNLANAWAARGYRVHLLLARGICPYPDLLDARVEPVSLDGGHSVANVLPLVGYLRRESPAVLLAVKFRPIIAALLAAAVAKGPTRVFPRLDVAIEGSLPRRRLKRWARLWPVRHLYPRASGIIALSQETAGELRRLSPGLDARKIRVIANPVITPELELLAREEPDHPWALESGVPLIVSAGRFTRRKDFATLIRAFALLRRQRSARLVILGDGPEHAACSALARELGVADDLALPGYRDNPFAYFSRAALFVLSSRAEGSPNVLTEAMALGLPVVATDCPFGPRALLDDGRLGPLVPVGDAGSMARAMARTLDDPPDPGSVRAAVSEFRVDVSAERYLAAFGLPAAGAEAS